MPRRLWLLLPLLGVFGCSAKAIRPQTVQICGGGQCENMNDESSRDRALAGLHELLKQAKGKRVAFHSANASTGAEKKRGISFFVQGGPIPGRSTISGMDVEDVLFIERQTGQAKARVKANATYVAVPLLCSGSNAEVSVRDNEVRFAFSNLCTWIGAGTTVTKFEWMIDRIDLDQGVASGHWSARTAGVPVVGGGSGYLLARFRPVEEPKRAPPPPPKPALSAEPKPVEVEVEVVSEAVELKLGAKLKDENGNLILEGGERVKLTVTAENTGRSLASGVELVISGEPTLVGCFGGKRALGAAPPDETISAELECRLPAEVPSETVILRLDLLAGDSVAASRALKVGMKPAHAAIVEEVVSELSVDDIPRRSKQHAGADNVALVIGLSRYREKAVPGVKYAARDAEVMARYLENVAGVPASNLKVLTDDSGTKSDFEAYLEDWLPRRVTPESTVFVYYAGHGAPDVAGKESFLVPYEGHPDFPTKLYPLKRVYEALAKLPAKAVVVMLDSCFSGAKGRGLTRAGARPLVHASEQAAPANVVVLAGASGSQIASDLDSVEHGLFTYFLLRGLRGEADADRDGNVVLGELYAFVKDKVSRRASTEFNRDQTPALIGQASKLKLPIARR